MCKVEIHKNIYFHSLQLLFIKRTKLLKPKAKYTLPVTPNIFFGLPTAINPLESHKANEQKKIPVTILTLRGMTVINN